MLKTDPSIYYRFLFLLIAKTTNMHYELGGYEALLMRSDGGTAETIASEFHTENERIRLAFLELLCSNEPDEILHRHAHTHQKALLRLAGMLENQPAGKAGSQRSIKIEALGALFDNLADILKDFWDEDEAVPWFHRDQIREMLVGRQAELVNVLKKSGVDKHLVGLLLRFKAGYILEGNSFTYRQWWQVRELVTAVEQLQGGQQGSVEGATERIIEHLFRLQIHNTSLFNYIENKTRQDLAKIKDPAEQLFFLEGTFRNVSNIVTLKDPFQPPEPGSLLAIYIEWLEKLIQQKEAEIAALSKAGAEALGKVEKIVTSLSVPELALMIRLFIQTGVFKNENLSHVARFMAELVETRKSKPGKAGSPKNLYQLLFKVPMITFPAVREILQKMLKKLDDLEAGKGEPLPDAAVA